LSALLDSARAAFLVGLTDPMTWWRRKAVMSH
jgi:hypothetical protein